MNDEENTRQLQAVLRVVANQSKAEGRREAQAHARRWKAAAKHYRAALGGLAGARTDVPALVAEVRRLRAFLDELGARDVPCRCGSGAHPRKCERHPDGMRLHVAELNAESSEENVVALMAENDRLRDLLVGLAGALARCDRCGAPATYRAQWFEDVRYYCDAHNTARGGYELPYAGALREAVRAL